jgi:hypothetical protein
MDIAGAAELAFGQSLAFANSSTYENDTLKNLVRLHGFAASPG